MRGWSSEERKALQKALVAFSCRDAQRYDLAGLKVFRKDVYATDGHRLLCVSGLCDDDRLEGLSLPIFGQRFDFADVLKLEPRHDFAALMPDKKDIAAVVTLDLLSMPKIGRGDFAITRTGITLGFTEGALAHVDGKYLQDLPRTDDEVVMTIHGPQQPIVFRPERGGWHALVMPKRGEGRPVVRVAA